MIEIDMGSLMKTERGTHKEKVPVHRKTGTTWEYRRVGRKEEPTKKPPRKDTGKIAALPEEIRKEILELRKINYSGANIKRSIEDMIDHDINTDTTSIIYTKTGDPVSTGRNFLEEGLIDKHGKLTITGQALTDWAKKRGVDTSHKHKTIKTAVAEATEIADSHFQEANRKLAEVQTKNKELKTDLERERKSHTESDEIRRELGKDNLELKAKIKELEAKIKENESKVKNLKEKDGKIREKVKEKAKVVPDIFSDTTVLSDRLDEFLENSDMYPVFGYNRQVIKDYTESNYLTLNEYLRSDSSGDEEADDQIDIISEFLQSAPSVQGTVYRGMSFPKEESDSLDRMDAFLEDVEEGNRIQLKSFTSTSTDEFTADEFAKNADAYTVTFEIQSKRGVFLNGLAYAPDEESEVLFNKNSKFDIIKVDKSKYPAVVHIVMEEIE